MLATLVMHEFAVQHSSGSYALGVAAFEVGSAVDDSVRYGGALARPMQDLAEKSGEAVSLSVVHGRHAVMVQRFESREILRAEIRIGTRMPLFTCASGKYYLAHLEQKELDQIYPYEELPLGAPKAAFKSKTALLKTFPQIREQNYAINLGEYTTGIDGLATGICDAHESIVAILSIAGPSMRFDVETWTQPLLDTARRMNEIQANRSTNRR